MNTREYRREIELEEDARSVFRWHARPGAFERLVPPWESVRLEGPTARIEVGAQQEVSLALGPLRRRWRSEITSVRPDREFSDTQLSGPFAAWVHTHSMRDTEGGHSRLEDHVRYRLPLGALGSLVAGRFVRAQLERMFRYRQRLTEQDLARHRAVPAAPRDILVSGASGFVGQALCAFLTTGGHRVRRLVRSRPRNADEFGWDPQKAEVDRAAFEGVDAVVHLAGENIAGARWSAARKRALLDSRVEGTRQIVDAMRASKTRPRSFLCASAIGYYGDRGDERLDESSESGQGFLAELCRAWESEACALPEPRAVQLRFGVVLGGGGGALARMLPPFSMGAGGRLGSGSQWMSWVALDDVIGAIHHALFDEGLAGPVNVVAPGAVTNAEFTRTLGRVLRRPTIATMPAFAARLAFGELADELLLAGQHVLPRRLQQVGYRFSQPELEGALRHQLGR